MVLCSYTAIANTTQSQNVPNANNLYFGIDVGYGALTNGNTISAIKQEARDDGVTVSDSNFVTAGHFGYSFNHYIAAQLEYLFLPFISFSYNGSYSTIFSNMIAFEIKGQYPLMNDKLFPFVTAGYGIVLFLTDNNDNVNTTSVWEPIISAGLEYKINQRIGINTQYKILIDANNKSSTVNMGLVGFNFYF